MQPDTHAQSSAGNCRKLQSLHLHTALRHAASDPACQSPPDSDPGFHGHCTLLDLNLQTLQLIVITPPGGLAMESALNGGQKMCHFTTLELYRQLTEVHTYS